MTSLQKIVYIFLNNLARISLRVFYSKLRIRNREYFPKNTATIIAPNHPNTMGDPILMATITPGWIHFLANYGLFKHPFTKFLMDKVFFSIPVKRPKDVAPGEMINNLNTIKICSKVLGEKGTIFMGPEATSYSYRRIRPLKDGIARIALTAAKSQKFKSGLVIMPMASNYQDPTEFRSEFILNVGKPIYIDNYKDLYKKDKNEAAQDIMNTLRERLEGLSIHTEDEIENQFLVWCETFAKTEKIINSFPEQLEFDKKQVPTIRALRHQKYNEFESIWIKLYEYFNTLEKSGIDDASLVYANKKNVTTIKYYLIRFFVFPIYAIGCLLNCVWFIPPFLFKKLKLYKAYTSMVNILTGLVLFPIFYTIIFSIVGFSFGLKWLLIYITITLFTGLSIFPYHQFLKSWNMKLKAAIYQDREKLIQFRERILEMLKTQSLL